LAVGQELEAQLGVSKEQREQVACHTFRHAWRVIRMCAWQKL
jgi:hypothetical protein